MLSTTVFTKTESVDKDSVNLEDMVMEVSEPVEVGRCRPVSGRPGGSEG